MVTLHIEHPVFDFVAWKRTFDAFGERRMHGGVRSYRVLRPIDDPKFAIIDLEFDDVGAAREFLSMLAKLWESAEGTLIATPLARILETVEQQAVTPPAR